MLNEKKEEILESVWVAGEKSETSLAAIRKRCVVQFSESDIRELADAGLIVQQNDNILFTNEGKNTAQAIIRRHRLAEVLVSSVLKLKDSSMEEVACKVEHCLEPEVEESICILLGHPEICPDGNPIPKGKCCEKQLRQVDNTVVSLSQLASGENGRITYMKPGTHSNLHQLMSIGLQPGIVVTVHRRKPVFCIRFENTELALDEELAANIFVWKTA